MRKTFEVNRLAVSGRVCWTIWPYMETGNERFPAEFRAFDQAEIFRRQIGPVASCYLDNTLQMLVAVDWLLERDWELDLSRCDKAFLSVYPVTAEAA